MKYLIIYTICALLTNSSIIPACLPQSYFCFKALCASASAGDEEADDALPYEDSPAPESRILYDESFSQALVHRYIPALSAVSLGFLISEILVLISAYISGTITTVKILDAASLPVPLYIVNCASVCAALSHLKKGYTARIKRLICIITPFIVIVTGIVINRI